MENGHLSTEVLGSLLALAEAMWWRGGAIWKKQSKEFKEQDAASCTVVKREENWWLAVDVGTGVALVGVIVFLF